MGEITFEPFGGQKHSRLWGGGEANKLSNDEKEKTVDSTEGENLSNYAIGMRTTTSPQDVSIR